MQPITQKIPFFLRPCQHEHIHRLSRLYYAEHHGPETKGFHKQRYISGSIEQECNTKGNVEQALQQLPGKVSVGFQIEKGKQRSQQASPDNAATKKLCRLGIKLPPKRIITPPATMYKTPRTISIQSYFNEFSITCSTFYTNF